MKKFIPYILIAVMIGTFAWLSFASSVSNTKQAEAGLFDVAEKVIVVGAKIFSYQPLFMITDALGVTDSSTWGDWNIIEGTFGQILAWISSFIWHISSKIFTYSGYLLDYAVDFSVRDFKTHIEQISVIDIGYKIVLNVANMLFIFILLYMAIKTILGVGGDTKKLLTNIIIVGLLINFSLFMTKAIIDASNIVAMGFYNGIQTEAGETEEGQTIIAQGSIATAMMAGLKLQTMIPSLDSKYNKEDPSKGLTNFNIALNYLGGSAMFLISAFVFLSAALLFIVRFVALLFYMLFSPVAFLGMISPELKEYSSKWWNGLQSQALFAPAFLFLAYIVSAIVNSGQLWAAVGGDKDPASNVYDVISATGQVGGFGIIMNYVILTALMIGALITAKEMAGKGSAGVLKYTNKFQGWAQGVAGRNTLGRAAYMIGDSAAMAKLNAISPVLGGFVKDRFDNVAGASFGGSKGGYEKTLKDRIKKQTGRAKWIDKKLGKENTAEMVEDLETKKRLLEQEEEKIDDLKKGVSNAKEKYNKLEKEMKKRQEIYERENKLTKDYNTYKAEAAEKELEIASRKAEEAKKELENEEGKLKLNQDAIKISKKTIEQTEKELQAMKNKWKYTYADNIKYSSVLLNKLFPSGAEAAAEIRKGKKSAKELFEEAIKEADGTSNKKEGGEKEKEEKEEKP